MLAQRQPTDIRNLQGAFERIAAGWREDAIEFFRHDAPRILGILIIALILIRILNLITRRLSEFSKSQGLPTGLRAQQIRTVSSVIYNVGTAVILFLACIQILQTLSINIGPIIASAGIVGLAVGFGAQTLVKDVLNGFFILIENQFDVGDTVKLAGVQGTVEALTLRTTILRDADGTVHTIPNSTITIVSNQTRDWTQLALHVSVDYKEDSDKVIRLLREVGRELRSEQRLSEDIVADPEVPGIERVSSSEVDYLMVVKTRPGRQFEVSRELRRLIKDCFQKNGISPGGQNRFYVVSDTAHPQAK